MTTYYDCALAVWLKLETAADGAELAEALREHLETEYQIMDLEPVED